jgi:hypothetical protein
MLDTLHVPGNEPDHVFDVPSGPFPLHHPIASRVVAPTPNVVDGGRDGRSSRPEIEESGVVRAGTDAAQEVRADADLLERLGLLH